jgi:protein TonB
MNRTRILVFVIVVAAHVLIIAGLSFVLAAGKKNAEQIQELELADFQSAGNLPGGDSQAAQAQAAPTAPTPPPEAVDPGDETDDSPRTQSPAQGSDENASSVARGGSGPGGPGSGDGDGSESDFMPMQKISQLPVIAENSVRSKLMYPEMARKAGIEGTVYLELFIDSIGKIRKIAILKESPSGYGFASAAMSALEGCTCVPAKSEGKTVSVRYRYPIRFSLN